MALVLVLSGCSSSKADQSATTGPHPPGEKPSASTAMICSPEEQREIARYVGVKAKIASPTWKDHTYSCDLVYPDGTAQLKVKELGSWAETKAYFNRLVAQAGPTTPVRNMGQQAAQAQDGTMFVRKDWLVLSVDPRGLPSRFGVPPTSSADIAYTMADLIMACWTGE